MYPIYRYIITIETFENKFNQNISPLLKELPNSFEICNYTILFNF